MQLKYRGTTYDYQPPAVAMESSSVVGQYRGLEWRFRRSRPLAVQQPTLNLIYRGVAYTTGPAQAEESVIEQPVVPAAPVTPAPVHQLARALMMGHHSLIKQRQQSMLGRVAAQVGLGAEASHYWSPIQGKVNSGFWRSYDRSHVALS